MKELLKPDYSFPKSARILKNAEFSSIQKKSRRLYSKNFTALVAKSEHTLKTSRKIKLPVSARLGITVSKKTEKLAVKRNRIKRVIREAFRQIRHICPTNLGLVIVAKSSCANLSTSDFKQELLQLLKHQKIIN